MIGALDRNDTAAVATLGGLLGHSGEPGAGREDGRWRQFANGRLRFSALSSCFVNGES